MANYVWRGISGQQGDVHYLNPAAWTVDGAAATRPPGPGDTVTLAFPGPSSVPVFAAPGAAIGDTVSGQTLNFGVAGAMRLRVAHFNGTDLAASTTVNFTGINQLQFGGSGRWNGVVNVGTPAGKSDSQVLLQGALRIGGTAPTLTNSGTGTSPTPASWTWPRRPAVAVSRRSDITTLHCLTLNCVTPVLSTCPEAALSFIAAPA